MQVNPRWGWAWVTLCLSLAVHVADEATHDFLAVYNPVARSLRERLPLLPIPIFTYQLWLAGLVLVILYSFCSPLSPSGKHDGCGLYRMYSGC